MRMKAIGYIKSMTVEDEFKQHLYCKKLFYWCEFNNDNVVRRLYYIDWFPEYYFMVENGIVKKINIKN